MFDFCIDFVFQSLKYSVAVHQRLVFTSIAGVLFKVALLNLNDCGLYFCKVNSSKGLVLLRATIFRQYYQNTGQFYLVGLFVLFLYTVQDWLVKKDSNQKRQLSSILVILVP